MRWMAWILAAAMAAGCAGQASGGQPGRVEYAGRAAVWQPSLASLSGEACCSPNGYAGVSAIPGCCCGKSQPCCDNAWDGYCEHKARVQAWLARVGTAQPQWCPRVERRVLSSASPCVEHSAPTAQPTRAVAPVKPRPPAPQPPVADAAPTPPSEPPASSDETFRKPCQLWIR
jgi:hypothetical protein